jgi:flagella basal body P-ring formation protein FlgA
MIRGMRIRLQAMTSFLQQLLSPRIRAPLCAACQVVAIVLCCLPAPALATPDIANTIQLFLKNAQLPISGDVEITVGKPDPRLRLTPCAKLRPFVPNGIKMWGRTMLGVECVEGEKHWRIYVPVDVKVFAPALVAAQPLVRNQPITPDEVRVERVEVTQWHGEILTDPEQIQNSVPVRNIAAGEPLRRRLLRALPVVRAGDPVKVVYAGSGFTVSTGGRALNRAGDGQMVKVMTDSRHVVSGIARGGGIVEVK